MSAIIWVHLTVHCAVCTSAWHVSLTCKPKLCCPVKFPKCLYFVANSLYFGVKVQLPELLHAVKVKEAAMLLLASCKTVRA